MIPNNDNTQQEGAYRHNRIKALWYVKSFSFFILLPSKSERKRIGIIILVENVRGKKELTWFWN